VNGRDLIPDAGVVLFASIHRNGAVDGLITEVVLDAPLNIVGRNLTASPYLRFLLAGSIAVYRSPATAAESRENLRCLQEAARIAMSGRQVLMFPEGTSKLGPGLLPVKKGMAHLAKLAVKAAKNEKPVHIVPIGLHYTRGFAFRSDVEVTFGPSLTVAQKEANDPDLLTLRIAQAMAGVGVIFRDADEQRQGELFADMTCFLAPSTSHREAALAYGSGALGEDLRHRFAAAVAGYDRHRPPPILPKNSLFKELLQFLIRTPLILTALLVNLLPCVGAPLVALRQADDDNVITLWRLLAGVPLWGLQFIFSMLAVVLILPQSLVPLLAGFGLVSWAGCRVYPRWRLSLAAITNYFSRRRHQYMEATKVVEEWLQQRI